jgi:hypothetical protein
MELWKEAAMASHDHCVSRSGRDIACDRPRVAGDDVCVLEHAEQPTWTTIPVRTSSRSGSEHLPDDSPTSAASIAELIDGLEAAAAANEARRRQTVLERAAVKAEIHRPVAPAIEMTEQERARCAELASVARQVFRDRFMGLDFAVSLERCKILEYGLLLAEGSATLTTGDGRSVSFEVSVVERPGCGAVAAGLWARRNGTPYEIYDLRALAEALRAQPA